jgi:hypothetical protein
MDNIKYIKELRKHIDLSRILEITEPWITIDNRMGLIGIKFSIKQILSEKETEFYYNIHPEDAEELIRPEAGDRMYYRKLFYRTIDGDEVPFNHSTPIDDIKRMKFYHNRVKGGYETLLNSWYEYNNKK